VLGTFSDDLEHLREAFDRSQGKEDAAEWLAALNTAQKGLIDRVATALASSAEDVFLRVRRLTVEFLPRAYIESTGVRDWIPESSMKRETLFPILRDACGGAGRVRAVFTANQLATWLFNVHKIKISGPLSMLRRGAEILARAGLDNNEIATPETTARARLNVKLGDTRGDECVEDLLQCGLIVRRGFRIGFSIATVQEYLVGCALADIGIPDVAIWFGKITRRPWAQAVQFAIEKSKNVETRLSEQLATQDDYFWTSLLLIARSIVNGTQVSKDFKRQVAVKLAEAWLSSTYDVGQSIGQLIADGFAKPPPLGLTELLKTKRAGHFGRIDILQRIGDGDLILDCLKEIVGEKDIRELWASAWIEALKSRAAEAVKILLDRASREKEDSLAAAVIAEVLYGLRDCETVRWSDITKNRIYPIAIRAAAHFGASTENSDDGRATITEFCRTSEHYNCWLSVSKALLSTTWWRDDLAKVLMTGVKGGRSSRPELESYLEIGPEEPAAQELIAELRNLARSGRCLEKLSFISY
jgi:hypothetical protein